MPPALTLNLLPDRYAICRLPAAAPWPAWIPAQGLVSITRTAEELSVVCVQSSVPAEVQQEGEWRCLQVAGPLDFGLTGILAALAQPLAEARISLFALSTYDTDYVLVRAANLERALAVLRAAGHTLMD